MSTDDITPSPQRNRETGFDLKAVLTGGEPARTIEPLPPGRVDALIRATTSIGSFDASDPDADAESDDTPRATRRRTIPVAWTGIGLAITAAAAAVIVAAGGPTTTAVTELDVPTAGGAGAPAAMCAEITPDALRRLSTALEARVTRIDNGEVHLDVTHTYTGDVDRQVQVPQQAADLPIEFTPAVFEQNQSYLIGTIDGYQNVTCAASGPATPELRSLFDRAFPQ